jgi:MOSC domain-containing protein YiiM
MPRRFGEVGKPGFYLRVMEEGEVNTGDEIIITSRADDAISVADIRVAERPAGLVDFYTG